jgi:hypothetical protein
MRELAEEIKRNGRTQVSAEHLAVD